MKKILFLIVLVFSISIVFGQTEVKDKQEVYGTWKKSKSPYIVEGEAIVPKGKVLKIKPGVVVKFKTGEDRDYRVDGVINTSFNIGFLRVNGQLIAKGKKSKLIKFTRHGGTGTWGNIAIHTNNDQSILKYCWFEASHYIRNIVPGDNATGSLSFRKSGGTVENCLFINNGWTAFNCKEGSSPNFTNNTVIGNEYAIECNSGSSPNIVNTLIWNNRNLFYVNGGSKPQISYSLVQGNYMTEEIIDNGNNILGKAPDFIDPSKENYGIKSSSPAYKKGTNGLNIGAM